MIMVDYYIKLVGVKPVGKEIEALMEKGFSYANDDFSFYWNIR